MEKENAIEWYSGSPRATLSLTSRRHITKIKKLQSKFPTEIDYTENPDGSIYAHIPVSFIKINGPRQMSEEAKAAATERLRKAKS